MSQSPFSGRVLTVSPSFPKLARLHGDPALYAVPEFLSAEECDELIATARANGFRSSVTEGDAAHASRTSSSWYAAGDTEFPWLQSRVCDLLPGMSPKFLEHTQVTHYAPGQFYGCHLDSFAGADSNQRVGTVLMYLNDVPEGGATHFPKLRLRCRPARGTAVVFFPCDVMGTPDERLVHEAEVAAGDKYVAQVWVRRRPFRGPA